MNRLPSARIAERFREEPAYRFLVCADKFQTGYDEPLLHTMYVDKPLSGIKAVQTLSRLNRAHPGKHDVFVLDFSNDADTIRDAFAGYYRATILADETDPDRLHDLQADLDRAQVYSEEQVEEFARRLLSGAERDRLDPILDECAAVYRSDLDEDGQVAFKGAAKGFIRTYARSRRGNSSCCRTATPRSSRCRLPAAATGRNRKSTASPTSCAPSTTCLATSTGRTPTACDNSSPRPFPTAWPRTPPSATRSATRTRRTPASSTTARCCACSSVRS